MTRIVGELVGCAGLGLTCGGAYLLWGLGGLLLSIGLPLLAAYVARELRRA